MDARPYLRSLLEYNTWANAELYAKVRELPPEEVTKKRKTLLQSIHVSMNHLLSVDLMWHAHMEKRPHGISELRAVQHEDMDSLWEARQAMDQTLLDYLDGLSDADLEEIVDYELIGGNTGSLSRGWIADMFGQAESPPPIIDIPVYERAIKANNLNPLP